MTWSRKSMSFTFFIIQFENFFHFYQNCFFRINSLKFSIMIPYLILVISELYSDLWFSISFPNFTIFRCFVIHSLVSWRYSWKVIDVEPLRSFDTWIYQIDDYPFKSFHYNICLYLFIISVVFDLLWDELFPYLTSERYLTNRSPTSCYKNRATTLSSPFVERVLLYVITHITSPLDQYIPSIRSPDFWSSLQPILPPSSIDHKPYASPPSRSPKTPLFSSTIENLGLWLLALISRYTSEIHQEEERLS